MNNSFDIHIGCSNKQMESLIKQMINPQAHCKSCSNWSFEERKLFREKVRLLINYYKIIREFGECVKG